MGEGLKALRRVEREDGKKKKVTGRKQTMKERYIPHIK